MIRQQVTVCLPNRPGVLFSTAQSLGSSNVNIEAITIAENTDVGVIRMVVDNVEGAKKALSRMGIPCSVEDVVMLPLENKPASLAKKAARIAHADINIHYLYATSCNNGSGSCGSFVVISTDNLQDVERIWNMPDE